MAQAPLLTAEELKTMDLLVEVANRFSRIVGEGRSRHADLTEAVFHIHGLQRMVMAQATARAFPDTYRLLGETLKEH
jgi:hypothetical protein